MANKFLSGLFGRKKEDPPSTDEPPAPETKDLEPRDLEPQDLEPAADDMRAPEIADAETAPTVPSTLASPPDTQLSSPPPPTEAAQQDDPAKKKKGWLSRLADGLSKSSNRLGEGVAAIFTKKKLDDDTIEELEDLLISADLGVAAAARITEALAKDKFDKEISNAEVRDALSAVVAETLSPHEQPLAIDPAHRPHVILMIGVNGAGKTTTIGKLAQKFADDGKSVMLAAGDTFRAAAIEQLTVWGERTGAPVIAREVGADAAGLAFDALKEAQAAGTDILIIDTAGRLQNKSALMDELAKIVRVIKKIDPAAPHDVTLVLDATVGQNAIQQTKVFSEIAGVTGLIMTKLDGTARGGVLVALADQFALPIHYIGVGESVDDLQSFKAQDFARALAGEADAAAQ